MSEKWTRWEPIPNLEGKYSLESLCNLADGLHICFSPPQQNENKKKLKFFFLFSIDSFRISHEESRAQMIFDLKHMYGEDFYEQWTFFKVENSSYLKWLSEQSCTITDEFNLQHICCITNNTVLDIVNNYEPKISFIDTDLLT